MAIYKIFLLKWVGLSRLHRTGLLVLVTEGKNEAMKLLISTKTEEADPFVADFRL